MENISKRVKAAREAKGVTIDELSKATLISVSVINDIESGMFDKYKGDEQYVKMYLKKLAAYLDIDSEDLANKYIELTQEIQLKDLQRIDEEKKEMEQQGSTTFVDKMGDTFKNIQISNPINAKSTRRKEVYEDHYIKRYLKYILVGLLIVAIVCVIWYTYVSTSNGSTSDFDKNTSSVEGNVSESTDKDNNGEKEDKEEVKPVVPAVTLTKNAALDYTFKLDSSNTTFKLKIEFVGRTWASLNVNGETYSQFESRIYNNENKSNAMDATPETVELEFNVADFNDLTLRLGYNRGHRFYINDTQVPIEDSEYNDTNKTFKLTLAK